MVIFFFVKDAKNTVGIQVFLSVGTCTLYDVNNEYGLLHSSDMGGESLRILICKCKTNDENENKLRIIIIRKRRDESV